eukprot:TRINITY_DN2174_c0_g1_i8.p1 TRINITY_DN2174_c0_g1~~TRINITY_DN2174_c0_g1_i8.p1  ORF type:complete len:138 (+),score=23.04 TRINITY_DN2174_c0_g1_i8:125-538(+)
MESEENPASPDKLSAVEVYGFIGWIVTYIFFALLLLWLFLPDSWLARIGITYTINREYAISVPIIFAITVLYTMIVYQASNMIRAPSIRSYYTIKDEYSKELNPDSMKSSEDDGRIAAIYDIPITTCLLYTSPSPRD